MKKLETTELNLIATILENKTKDCNFSFESGDAQLTKKKEGGPEKEEEKPKKEDSDKISEDSSPVRMPK